MQSQAAQMIARAFMLSSSHQSAAPALLSTTSGLQVRLMSASAVPISRETGSVPPGHVNSDLSPTACHIGLGRRRDLTMRQDLSLIVDGEKKALKEVFQDKKVIVVGFPGGPVCTEQHIPGYVNMTDALERKGVDKVLCITPESPQQVKELSAKPGLTSRVVQLASDPGCGFIRLLGLELGVGKDAGPRCQRFAAIIENGILLRVKVEEGPAALDKTSVSSMCKLWDEVYSHLQEAKQ